MAEIYTLDIDSQYFVENIADGSFNCYSFAKLLSDKCFANRRLVGDFAVGGISLGGTYDLIFYFLVKLDILEQYFGTYRDDFGVEFVIVENTNIFKCSFQLKNTCFNKSLLIFSFVSFVTI